jgi:hypothetical protein
MKYKGLFFLILLTAFIGTAGSLCAQERDDFGIWSQIDLGARISEKWTGGLWFEHRSKDNAGTLDCALMMPYVNYRPWRHLQLGYSSEFIQTLGGWLITCRPSVTLLLGEGNLSFALRELPIYTHDCTSGSGKWALRTRGKVAYAIPDKRFKPYVSCELFTTRRWEKTRYYAGTTCALGPRSTLDIFYLYYVMAGTPNRERHVLGLGYAFKI